MTAREFFDVVVLMRIYQKEYFKTRDKEVLIKSKHYEKLVDHEIDRVKNVLNERNETIHRNPSDGTQGVIAEREGSRSETPR